MSLLSNTDRELILDYCLEQLSDNDILTTEKLIKSNPEAKTLYNKIKSNLQPLTTADLLQPCPDDLAALTVARLVETARQEDQKLQQLINQEQARSATIKIPLWHRLTQVAAVAAVVLVLLSVAIPALKHAKNQSLLQRCEGQLATIYQGMDLYRQANDGELPTITVANGSPWWKVGYQGEENYSNTRSVWMLASQGFVEPQKFVCPARMQTITSPAFDDLAVDQYKDFPDRTYLSYSPRVSCEKSPRAMSAETLLMADTNPLTDPLETEAVPSDYNKTFNLRLSQTLLQANSRNHNGLGQNILAGDGSAKFYTSRLIDNDDIYTLRTMGLGAEIKGCETPDSATDAFLAP